MVAIKQIYTPIIKGKMYDLKSLGRLSEKAKLQIKPLVEAMPVPKDVTVDAHLEKFSHYVSKYYPSGALFVDFYGLMPGAETEAGVPAVVAGYHLLVKKGRVVTPCYGFARDDSIWSKLSKIAQKLEQGFCFRIDIDDLDDASEDTWTQIIERSSDLNLPNFKIDLLIDLRDIRERDVSELRELVIDFLSGKPAGPAYRSITVAGSSALKSVTPIPKDGEGDVDRHELQLWIQLQHELGEIAELTYGDYGVIHPDFSDAAQNPNTNSKIRYTSGRKIRYFRGHRLADAPGYAYFHQLAERVRNSDIYRGSEFSVGDKYIDDCADFNSGPGNLSTWVLVDMNHHLEYSTAQIARLKSKIHDIQSMEDAEELLLVE